MPGATDLFQGMSAPQQGPFSSYLQPRAIDNPTPAPTGWETKAGGMGGVALGFLKGVRQNRVAQFAEQEQNNQSQFDAYQRHVNAQLQDPGLTDAAKKSIIDNANAVMAQHAQYEVRDVPKDGVGGFFKNLLIHATGGPIKTREPINFQQETGKIAQALQDPTTQKSYWIKEANRQLDAETQEGMSAEQVQSKAAAINRKMELERHLGAQGVHQWIVDSAIGRYPAGSTEDLIDRLNRSTVGATPAPSAAAAIPPTQPPPEAPTSPVAGAKFSIGLDPDSEYDKYFRKLDAAAQSDKRVVIQTPDGQEYPNIRVYGPGSESLATPPSQVATTAPPPGVAAVEPPQPGVTYDQSWGPKQYSILQAMHAAGKATIGAPHLATTMDGARKSVVYISSPAGGSGYWDTQSQQLIKEPMVPVSLAATAHRPMPGPDRFAMVWDPQLRKNVYDIDPDGKRYKIPEGSVMYTDPITGDVRWEARSVATANNSLAGAQGIQAQRDRKSAERLDRSIAAGNTRQQNSIDASFGRQITGIDARRAHEKETLNLSFDHEVQALERSALGRLTASMFGRTPSAEQIAQAKASVQPDIDAVEAKRDAAIKRFDAAQPVRTTTPVPRTTAPPAPPRQTPANPAPAVATPAVGGLGAIK